jgi:hypothetical protein
MSGRSAVDPGSESSPATDFAITTVNIPDRLDAQEVRARADFERDVIESGPGAALTRWLWVAAMLIAALSLAAFVWRATAPVRGRLSSDGVSERLTGSLGVPVSVGKTSFRFVPAPAFEVRDIKVQGQYAIPLATLQLSWNSVVKAMQGGGWEWGELRVGPMELTSAQGLSMLQGQTGLVRVLPESVKLVRFNSLSFSDTGLLPARYEAVATRTAEGGPIERIALSEIGSGSDMALLLTPSGVRTAFHLKAARARLPFGPPVTWEQVLAEGSFTSTSARVETLGLRGWGGEITGSVAAAKAAAGPWAANGSLQGSNVDLVAVLGDFRARAPRGNEQRGGPPVAQGSVDFSASIGGRGSDLDSALAHWVATGKARVRFGVLNGISLGTAATQGMSSPDALTGSTRFADLEALFIASPSGLTLREISGRSGALRVSGAVSIGPDLSVDGLLRSEVATAHAGRGTDVRVSGTVLTPLFGD